MEIAGELMVYGGFHLILSSSEQAFQEFIEVESALSTAAKK